MVCGARETDHGQRPWRNWNSKQKGELLMLRLTCDEFGEILEALDFSRRWKWRCWKGWDWENPEFIGLYGSVRWICCVYMQETRLFQSCMCFHLCVMIYAFVDSFISQFDFGVPSIYSRSECSTMPQARDQLFVLARGCQWHQTADTLWVWHSTFGSLKRTTRWETTCEAY